MKKKMSLENRITLAQNNAIDFTHACVTIALHEVFGLGRKRLEKVDKCRNEVNGEVLRIMAECGRPHEAKRNAEAWLRSRLPKGTPWELLIPNAKGVAKTHAELKIKSAVDEAATVEWRVYAVACAEVLGFSTERLIRLYDATMDNYRQLNQWVLEEGVDVALEWFRRAAAQGYGTKVEVLDVPEEREVEAYRQHSAEAVWEVQKTQIRAQVSRMRVPCTLPLAKDEMDRRIRAVMEQQAPTSWERRRTK